MLWWTLSQLRTKNWRVRKAAAEKLAGSPEPRVVEALIKSAMSDSDSAVRQAAAASFATIGHPDVAPLMVQLLSHGVREVNKAAEDVLKAMGPASLPHVIPLLRGNPHLRKLGCRIVGEIRDSRAVPALAEIVADRHDDDAHEVAVEALAKIGDKEAIGVLVTTAAGPRGYRASQALRDLGGWQRSEGARAAMTELIERLDGDAKVIAQLSIVEVVAEIGDRRAVPSLVRLLGRCEPQSIRNVVDALDRIDPAWGAVDKARVAVPRLLKALDNSVPAVRGAAAHALGALRASTAVEALIKALADARGDSVEAELAAKACIVALGEIGASYALPALLDQYTGNVYRREEAAASMRRIDPDWGAHLAPRLVEAFLASGNLSLLAPLRGLRDAALAESLWPAVLSTPSAASLLDVAEFVRSLDPASAREHELIPRLAELLSDDATDASTYARAGELAARLGRADLVQAWEARREAAETRREAVEARRAARSQHTAWIKDAIARGNAAGAVSQVMLMPEFLADSLEVLLQLYRQSVQTTWFKASDQEWAHVERFGQGPPGGRRGVEQAAARAKVCVQALEGLAQRTASGPILKELGRKLEADNTSHPQTDDSPHYSAERYAYRALRDLIDRLSAAK